MKIPLMNLSSQYEELKDNIDRVMKEIAQASRFVLGRENEEFERDVCKYCNVKYDTFHFRGHC